MYGGKGADPPPALELRVNPGPAHLLAVKDPEVSDAVTLSSNSSSALDLWMWRKMNGGTLGDAGSVKVLINLPA